MQHHIIKPLLFSASLSKVHRTFFTLALGAMLLVACDPDDMFNINDTIPTDTVPQQPDPQPVSLVGTAWENLSVDGNVTDKDVLRFVTDSTGTDYGLLSSNGQVIIESLDDIKYRFDGLTLEGAYWLTTHPENPISFSYNPADTTITTDLNRTYHPLAE